MNIVCSWGSYAHICAVPACIGCDVIELMKCWFHIGDFYTYTRLSLIKAFAVVFHACLLFSFFFCFARRCDTFFATFLVCYLRMKWATVADTATSYCGTWCLRGQNIESNLFFYICPVVAIVLYFQFTYLSSSLSRSFWHCRSIHWICRWYLPRFIAFKIRCLICGAIECLFPLLSSTKRITKTKKYHWKGGN